jgi:hypothetical protein
MSQVIALAKPALDVALAAMTGSGTDDGVHRKPSRHVEDITPPFDWMSSVRS